jgi:hypothetical protein
MSGAKLVKGRPNPPMPPRSYSGVMVGSVIGIASSTSEVEIFLSAIAFRHTHVPRGILPLLLPLSCCS